MLSSASDRLNHTRMLGDRAQGAVLALLVQAGFILLLITARTTMQTPHNPVNETLLLLRALPRPAPSPPPATAPSSIRRPAIPLIIPAVPSFTPVPQLAPPSGIAGFGRTLFGCAPEHYADLPPDERAHCPKPGEGLAVNQPPDLLNPPKSRAKDEALWQEQWAEDHWVPPVCPPGEAIGAVVGCVLEQSIAENRRQQVARQKIADDKAARLQEPRRPLPNIGVRRN
jgi:hypothetical protein